MNFIKILNWNILGAQASDLISFEKRYPNVTNWSKRFQLLIEKIISFDADIICLQEIDTKRKKEFADSLHEYGFQESSYEKRAKNGGVIVLHKASKFKVIDKKGMQLTGGKALKNSGASAWVTLLCKQTQQKILINSLHLHWEFGQEQLIELMQALKTSISIPMILAGDFNIAYKTMLKKILINLNQLRILKNQNCFSLFEHSSYTTQPPHNIDPTSWESLDHIIFSSDLKLDLADSFVGNNQHTYQDNAVKKIELAMKDNSKEFIPSDICPSDHLPIIASFMLGKR